jgi:hypothetical protein
MPRKINDKKAVIRLAEILQDSLGETGYGLIPSNCLLKNAITLALNTKDSSGVLDKIMRELESREITAVPDDEILEQGAMPNPDSLPAGEILTNLVTLLNKGIDHRADTEKTLTELVGEKTEKLADTITRV